MASDRTIKIVRYYDIALDIIYELWNIKLFKSIAMRIMVLKIKQLIVNLKF